MHFHAQFICGQSPFLELKTHRKAFSDGPQRVSFLLCVEVTNAVGGFEQPVWQCLDLIENGWTPPAGNCRSSAMSQYNSAMSQIYLCFLGAPFHPQQAAPHPQLPGALQLQTSPITVMVHLQELPPGLWCSPGPASCWWVDGFHITCQIAVYVLLKWNTLTFKVSIWN